MEINYLKNNINVQEKDPLGTVVYIGKDNAHRTIEISDEIKEKIKDIKAMKAKALKTP